MDLDQLLILSLLLATLALFAWGRWRYDLVALIALLAAVVAGLVPAENAFLGFGHPAVVTVAAVLVISRAFRASGVLQQLLAWLQRLPADTGVVIAVSSGLVALASAFMNNIGALALMLPVVIQLATAHGIPPYRLFMPLGFGSMLGGMITLIGTPPNIIIATFQSRSGTEPFAMFDFAPVGLVATLFGIVFMALVGWRLIPVRREAMAEDRSSQIRDYMAELKVPRASQFVGRPLAELEATGEGDFAIVALIRRRRKRLAPNSATPLAAGDTLLVECDPDTLTALVKRAGLRLVSSPATTGEAVGGDVVVAEMLVKPGSVMEGRTAGSLRLHARFGCNLLAISRSGRPVRQHIGHVQFRAGDVVLLQAHAEQLADAIIQLDGIALNQLSLRFDARVRLGVPALFGAAVLVSAFGLLPIQVAFVAAVVLMVITHQIAPRELYGSIDWPIIVLLGAMLPLGEALETTGAAGTLAGGLLALPDATPGWLFLVLLMAAAMALSNIVNNAATALLMAPIAVDLAQGLGVAAAPFLMGVAVASSTAFLTPIGHQSNLLVMGPGGYRFEDYWQLGLPLSAIVLATTTPVILWLWPLA